MRTSELFMAVLVGTCLSLPVMAAEPFDQLMVVVGGGPGGGYDRTGRAIELTLKAEGLVTKPIVVSNRPGAGGTVAWAYMSRFEGNAGYISPSSSTLLANDARKIGGFNMDEFTHLGLLAKEDLCFVMNPKGRIKSTDELINALKAAPEDLRFGFSTATGNPNHIAFALLADSVGVDISQVRTAVFKSAAEAKIGVINGSLDVSVSGIETYAKNIEAGELICGAVSSNERLPAPFDNIPTWKELGVDIEYFSWRGLIAPGKMTKEGIEFWDRTLNKLTKSKSWEKALQNNSWSPMYMNYKETQTFLQSERKRTSAILKKLGII